MHYVNDYSPQFHPRSGNYNKTISEGVLIGTFVVDVNATDKDNGTQGHVYYSLPSGNIGNSFKIDNISGRITTRTKLDRETTAIYNLCVRASDGAVPDKVRFSDGIVIINVLDVNDNSPDFIQNPFVSQVSEIAVIDDVIVRAKAVDADTGSNAKLRYSLTSGNVDGYFQIRSNTGDIVVRKSLDLESVRPPPIKHVLGRGIGSSHRSRKIVTYGADPDISLLVHNCKDHFHL